jgi:hypothetical protein
MSTSWLLDPTQPSNQFTFPTQATYFGSSSLASASGSFIAVDPGKAEMHLIPMTAGNRQQHNLYIVDDDKSYLGMQQRAMASRLHFSKPDPLALTPPNKFSLRRDSLL